MSEWVFGILKRTAHHQSWCRSSDAGGCEEGEYRVKLHHLFSFSFFTLSCFGVVVFAETIVSQRRWEWFHAFSLAQPEMDVRFYPAPPANVGSCSLPTDPSCLSSLDYYHSNKVNLKKKRERRKEKKKKKTVCLHAKKYLMSHLSVYEPATFTQLLWMRFATGAHLLQTHSCTLSKKNVKCQQVKWPELLLI